MAAAKTISEALRRGQIISDPYVYRFIKLPLASLSKATSIIESSSSTSSSGVVAFQGLLVDKDEITMMVPSQGFEQNEATLKEETGYELGKFQYRLITFDVVLDPTLIGFMARITKVLALASNSS